MSSAPLLHVALALLMMALFAEAGLPVSERAGRKLSGLQLNLRGRKLSGLPLNLTGRRPEGLHLNLTGGKLDATQTQTKDVGHIVPIKPIAKAQLVLLADGGVFNKKTLEVHPKYFGVLEPAQIQVTPLADDCGESPGTYEATAGWRRCHPEKLGVDSTLLYKAVANAADAEYRTESVLVFRGGYLLAEGYFGCNDKSGTEDCTDSNTTHHSWSVAKSVTSALIGLSVESGAIENVDVQAGRWIKEWDPESCWPFCDARQDITIQQVMTVTTGLKWKENWAGTGALVRPANIDVVLLDLETLDPDPVEYVAVKDLRPGVLPGQSPLYSTGDPALLTQVIESVENQTAYSFADERIFAPLGMKVQWLGDKLGRTRTYARIYTTPRDYAKFGQLYLNGGRWSGKQIVPRTWVEESTVPCGGQWDSERAANDQPCFLWYGYLWHVLLPVRLTTPYFDPKNTPLTPEEAKVIPSDAFMAEGVYGQFIVVIPSLDLVIVKTGDDSRPIGLQERVIGNLITDVIAALQGNTNIVGGFYQIVQHNEDVCLSANGLVASAGACTGDSDHLWYVTPLAGRGYVRLTSKSNDWCLSSDASDAAGAALRLERCDDKNPSQAWMIVDIGDGRKKIVNMLSGFVVDSGSSSGSSNVTEEPWAATDNQTFRFAEFAGFSANTVISQSDVTQLKTPDGTFELTLQADGNLVRKQSGNIYWQTGTAGNPGASLRLQNDGALVLHKSDGAVLWTGGARDRGLPPLRLEIENDGSLVLRDSVDTVTWTLR